MANVLLAWELGAGLGHLMTLLPLAQSLCRRGHRVYATLRDLSRANALFGGLEVSCIQAPYNTHRPASPIAPVRTFAQILYNNGFYDLPGLSERTEAWRQIYHSIRPDLIVFDHSPTALLAARGFRAKRALIGNGFFCPPDISPLPDLRPWLSDGDEHLIRDESRVLENVNRILLSIRQMPIGRLSQLYAQVDENLLTTFPELDQYPNRPTAKYWGAWPSEGGKAPVWPEGRGKRIYVYVRPFPGIERLFIMLRMSRCPTLVFADGIDKSAQRQSQSATLRFENDRLDLHHVARECDLAILNGSHTTSASMLLAGKPILELPIHLEQGTLSTAVAMIGAGLTAAYSRPRQIAEQFVALLRDDRYAAAAGRFAARYAGSTASEQVRALTERVAELAG